MEKEKKFVSLVVYLHDNENEIESFLNSVLTFAAEHFTQYELVCVDDACTEKTLERVSSYVSEKGISSMINIVHMSFYQGLESAMNAGRDLAIGDFVYEFDSVVVDYDVAVLEEVYKKLLEGYDIVSASSDRKAKFSSRMFYRIYNSSSREKANELRNESFRLISRRAINRVKSLGLYIPYRKAVYANCGLKSTNIKYASIGGNKVAAKTSERVSLAFDSFVYFTNFLEKISTILSGVFLLTTIGIFIYILSDVVLHHNTADGWLSIMGFLSVGFFGMFLLLTIVLKYLSTLLNLVFKQQRYVVSDIEKVTGGKQK